MEVFDAMQLDSTFMTDFKHIFNGKKVGLTTLSDYVTDTLIKKADQIDYLQTINILKTCHTVCEPYAAFKVRAYRCVKPFKDRDKFLLSLVLISIGNMNSPIADEFLVTSEDALLRAVKRSYDYIDVGSEGIMKCPEALEFNEDVGERVNSWDEYFYNVCKQVARNSKCLSRKIGAILVRDKSIVSTGYNGPPRGVPMCDERWKIDDLLVKKYGEQKEEDVVGKCPRYVVGFKSGEGLEICVAGHAERNSLINAARNGIATKGTTMYMTCGIPCSPCLVEIINAGVKEIVVANLKFYDELNSRYLLDTSNLKMRVFDFIVKK
jgi:dCMP deaminase